MDYSESKRDYNMTVDNRHIKGSKLGSEPLPPIKSSQSDKKTTAACNVQEAEPTKTRRETYRPTYSSSSVHPEEKQKRYEEEEEEWSNRKRNKRWCFIMSVVAIIAIIVCLIFLIIIIVLSSTKTRTEKRLDLGESQSFPSTLTLSTPFDAQLSDPNSIEYHTLAELLCAQIELSYTSTMIADVYQGCFVTGFSNGSTKVSYTIVSDPLPKEKSKESMEYLLTTYLEESGEEMLPDFVAGSVNVTSTGPASVSELALVDAMVNDLNCDSQPCLNDGECIDGLDDFFCNCTQDYMGKTCGIDVTECSNMTCSGHGQCVEVVGGGTECVCDEFYDVVSNCSVYRVQCVPQPCGNGATCAELGGGDFDCTCVTGYEGDLCDMDTDDCTPDPCDNGDCEDQVDGYVCLCDDGYDGTLCDNDINDCSPDPCIHGSCTDSVAAFSCACDAGYEGDTCAVDTDDCTPDPCDNGVCEDQVDGYICLCDDGYDGTLCDNNIDLCDDDQCIHGNCTSSVGGFTCSCDTGYEGTRCETNTDDCGNTNCDTCFDLVNDYYCVCEVGYTGKDCEENIDDCASNPCTYQHQTECRDLINGYNCVCEAGYTGLNCREIDYCCTNVSNSNQDAEFYVYGSTGGDDTQPAGDDGCPGNYDFPIKFFGNPKSTAYVCYNGIISFDGEVGGYVSEPFPLTTAQSNGLAVLAGYWSDLDMSNSTRSSVFSRVTNATCELDRAAAEVAAVYGPGFNPTRALIVTWEGAPYYPHYSENNTEEVTFQIVVVTDDVDTYAMYIYGDMQWEFSTQVGFDAGDGINYYTVNGTRTPAMIDIETTSNIGITAKYLFHISPANVTAPPAIACGDPANGRGTCYSDPNIQDYNVTCFQGYSGADCLTGSGQC